MFLKSCGFLLFAAVMHAAEPRQLFNGKDFTGWTFDVIDPEVKPEAVWSVSKGIIICKGRPPGVMTLTVAGTQPQGRRWWKKGESAEKPPGQWNLARIRCEAGSIRVFINGTLVNQGTGLSATKGAICLQSEGNEIHFRKISLLPLE